MNKYIDSSYYPVIIRLKTKGSYRFGDEKISDPATEIVPIPGEKCPAAKRIFKNSAYAACSEFLDLQSKEKRTLVWEIPMT